MDRESGMMPWHGSLITTCHGDRDRGSPLQDPDRLHERRQRSHASRTDSGGARLEQALSYLPAETRSVSFIDRSIVATTGTRTPNR